MAYGKATPEKVKAVLFSISKIGEEATCHIMGIKQETLDRYKRLAREYDLELPPKDTTYIEQIKANYPLSPMSLVKAVGNTIFPEI